MKSSLIYIAILISFFLFLNTSCKKDKTTTDNSTSAKGNLILHMHTNVDKSEVEAYDTIFTTSGGRKISLSLAQLFISHIQAVKLNGEVVDFSGASILKTLDEEQYLIGSLPVGNYKSINFSVGLDANTNAIAPVNGSIFNNSAMWFGSSYSSTDGYVFMNLAGKIDTTNIANAVDSLMQHFEYKIGTNNHFISVNMPEQNFSIIENTPHYSHVKIDYYKVFDGVKLNEFNNLKVLNPTDNNSIVANKIATNITKMFSYE